MGVTGLWKIVQPCARPVKIETLNKKRLAVDASIWIYQFLKAVRDKEGQALRNSHVVGFFRRICKLLFYGIKPIFVFDGGAPALKRQTINVRKRRREGHREDATRTAGKLLALQMQRHAEQDAGRHDGAGADEQLPDALVYAEEVHLTATERRQRQQQRQQRQQDQASTFRRKDAYHLPELAMPLAEMGSSSDPRIMSLEELKSYASQFDGVDSAAVYDFSKIDFDGPFFQTLPATDRYNILNAARLRSRLRMGYSKEQLDSMFPDRMHFSRFQIERVRERNELTQRLMTLADAGDDALPGQNLGGRVIGERGREYVLVRNHGVEGGWALGVVQTAEDGHRARPIEVDAQPGAEPSSHELSDDDADDPDDFEDVPVDGLNRLPKILRPLSSRPTRKRAPYRSHKVAQTGRGPLDIEAVSEDDGGSASSDSDDQLFEDIGENTEPPLDNAMMENLSTYPAPGNDASDANTLSETPVDELLSLSSMPAFIDHDEEKRIGSSDDDDALDLQAAIFESRRSKRDTSASRVQLQNQRPAALATTGSPAVNNDEGTNKDGDAPFSGPLPFESLNLGSALLRPKKSLKRQQKDSSVEIEPDPPALESAARTATSPSHEGLNLLADTGQAGADSPATAMRKALPLAQHSNSPTSPVANHLFKDEAAVPTVSSDVEEAATGDVQMQDDSDYTHLRSSVLQVGVSSHATFDESSLVQNEAASPAHIADIIGAVEEAAPTEAALEQFDQLDLEEEELLQQLQAETNEYARFVTSINKQVVAQNAVDYERELKALRHQQKKDRRDADEVTQTMIIECQQLLTLFGLPFITAPMEAEAQCAQLVDAGLVDGVVTDDSDIFLFGGTRVYKNMFSQAKFVECYLQPDLLSELGLSRGKLVAVAHLLGSDYTEGLPGIGPVTAVEILSEFGDLPAFKEWFSAVQTGSLPKTDDVNSSFRKKFRKNATKLFLPPSFPDARVEEAYYNPVVDNSAEPFQWGLPDLAALRAFLSSTIGWSDARTDEVLVPVIRDMSRREAEGTQANITYFFDGSVGAGAFAPKQRSEGKSKRLAAALTRLAGDSAGNEHSAGRPDTTHAEANALNGKDSNSSSIPRDSRRKRRKV